MTVHRGILLVFSVFIFTGCINGPKGVVTVQPTAAGPRIAESATAGVMVQEQDGLEPAIFLPVKTATLTPPGSQPSLTKKTVEYGEPQPSATADLRKQAKYWAEWPLIPEVSARAKEIYRRGLAMGNNPNSFSVIGDCQSEPNLFMGMYDTEEYELGEEYEYLEDTIHQFEGCFKRDHVTVVDGMSVASVLAPAWADPELCKKGETPLDCELRLHKPSIVFINLGTTWKGGDDVKHEVYMRKIVDILIARGVVPVLSTKGDNQEGGHRINESIAQVAYDYDLPLWNFWLSIRDLPGKGIDGTRPGGYLIPDAWGRRSFTGLQALDAVWKGLSQ